MLLIFDCDGVLVDSEIIALDILAKMLTAFGRPCDLAECRRLFKGKSVKDVLTEVETMLGRPLPAAVEGLPAANDRSVPKQRAIAVQEGVAR